jgi:tetratricopeptide (TPR) repeat protein
MNIESLVKQASTLKRQNRYDDAAACYLEAAHACIANNDPIAAELFNLAASAFSYNIITAPPSSKRPPLLPMKNAYDASINVYLAIDDYANAGRQAALAGNMFCMVQRSADELHVAIDYYMAASTFYNTCNLFVHANSHFQYAQYLQCTLQGTTQVAHGLPFSQV